MILTHQWHHHFPVSEWRVVSGLFERICVQVLLEKQTTALFLYCKRACVVDRLLIIPHLEQDYKANGTQASFVFPLQREEITGLV